MVAFAFCQGSTLSRLVESYSVNLMNFTFWTVSLYFFRNVHGIDQLCIKETYTFLYFMTYQAKTDSIQNLAMVFFRSVAKNKKLCDFGVFFEVKKLESLGPIAERSLR